LPDLQPDGLDPARADNPGFAGDPLLVLFVLFSRLAHLGRWTAIGPSPGRTGSSNRSAQWPSTRIG